MGLSGRLFKRTLIELGQDAPAERRVVDVAQNVNCLGDPADFGECARQCGSRWCMDRVFMTSPVPARISGDPDGGRHAEARHSI